VHDDVLVADLVEGSRDGSQLDELGPGADDAENLHSVALQMVERLSARTSIRRRRERRQTLRPVFGELLVAW
jgi:hypothetical protein